MCIGQAEADKLDGLQGREVRAQISQPRNIRFHRKYFALLKTAREMIDEEYAPEAFRAICLVGIGHCDFVPGDDGLIAIPKSISFADVDDTEFSRIYNDTVNYICGRWVLDDATLNQVVNFL